MSVKGLDVTPKEKFVLGGVVLRVRYGLNCNGETFRVVNGRRERPTVEKEVFPRP